MGQMRTISKADWTPRELVAADGRRYTPGSFREERELLASGYTLAPHEPPVPTQPAAAEQPEPLPTTAAPPAAVPEPEPEAPADDPAVAPKTKTTPRSNGGTK
ncbi:hypothetical protein F8M49_30100 [Rhodococcus zopfii]|uniref:Uncharacterized protein n=1 Tax=Rhodococcus zopfii TaxID=43772 RepID=A0ABU3WX64_9NOCA|nr:hypothetical protein [Rhodococcus zopfii]MDV2478611.1 hypothetical protein [Rhodococcus zopfii]